MSVREKFPIPPQALIDAGMSPEIANTVITYKGQGCGKCSETGYKGRIAIYEVMPVKEELKEFILNGAATSEIKREAMRLGMKSMRQSAMSKLEDGKNNVRRGLENFRF
jgi:type IV pilus assembly protein PilB